jgi:NAD(P)-dependent dehydrogenase (short-subunit alcohol dehydrogenase family)
MPLEGKTAVVTGAARGIGRGIALVLGEAGVTVYLTDRETRRRKRSPLPGTVEDTAEQGGLDLLVANAFGGDPDTIALHVYYDLAMHATSRLAFGLAQDLRPRGVTALAISPGFTRTEAITAQLGDLPPGSDSIEFPGRAVRALLDDPDVARHAGHTISVADLAKEYGFSDPEAAPAGGDQ